MENEKSRHENKDKKSKHEKKSRCWHAANICRRCGTRGHVLQKYGLMVCRRCLREVASDLGFKKYA